MCWYQAKLGATVATSGLTLRQLLYGVLVTHTRERTPVASSESYLRLLQAMSSTSKLIPTCFKTVLRVLGVDPWDKFERHFCDAPGCKGYVFPNIPRTAQAWAAAITCKKTGKCRSCGAGRFRVVKRGGRAHLEPTGWYIDCGFEEAAQSLFDDPAFVKAWREGRAQLLVRPAVEGSRPAGARLRAWVVWGFTCMRWCVWTCALACLEKHLHAWAAHAS